MQMELTNRKLFFVTRNEAKEKGLDISSSEIYLLLEKTNNFKNKTELVLNFDKNHANPKYFCELKEKIFNNVPIQYVLNSAPFLDLDLYVDERVLIPRVETEDLVSRIIKMIKDKNFNHKVIADMCTGSGCIALYLKKTYPDSKVYASDISLDALDVAKSNASKANIDVEFLHGDKTEPFITLKEKIDLFVSNPPYVEKMEDIEERVKKHEPMNAIYVKDGVSFYENVFKEHKKFMNDKFFMAFEINYDQQDQLTELIAKYFDDDTEFSFVKDIFDRTRFLFILKGY